MKIEIWSDYACPYCYIAKERLEKAMNDLGIKDQVNIEMRSFELDPNASYKVVSSTEDRFAKKYRLSNAMAAERIRQIEQLGREEGIDFRYSTTQYTNTMDAHRLTHYAEKQGNKTIVEDLFKAYFTDNLELSDKNVLKEIAVKNGLDENEVEKVLNSNEFESDVRKDESQAYSMGIQAVPFFLINGKFTLNGAQNVETFKMALKEAIQDDIQNNDLSGMSCGIDGCY
ncbi:DsbA family oxidoreductase [Paenibacillus gallinarum]|uniref:DsbA family oxidoreductase n=1 Tax=Paenibacillus gallinarum TaxID=2762232 RepID=A0ABR8T6B6_9BACL|nr:DsbA family oxidoreductase [Paenibacillus gallinarum]MBD7971315.1 DsbA family oxidoreductase [Paenibacillus gallinarum]